MGFKKQLWKGGRKALKKKKKLYLSNWTIIVCVLRAILDHISRVNSEEHGLKVEPVR